MEAQYDECLNEGELVKIGSLAYEPAQVLRAVDPIAYQAGFSDYCACGYEEIDGGDYYMESDDAAALKEILEGDDSDIKISVR